MRILVCGGRDFNDSRAVFRALDELHASERGPITSLIEGGARGVDESAYGWALKKGLQHKTYPADWAANGKAAGPIRNAVMLRDGNPDLVMAFPGGRGTAHMVSLARKAGVEVIEVAS
jgi:hypothetical protein